MKGLYNHAESITKEIEGVKIAGARRDLIYYTIRFLGGSISEGATFHGFCDPAGYGYALGEPLYTNILEANRVPDTAARWWALGEVRISVPGAKVEDALALITSFVLNLSVLRLESERPHDRDRLDLLKAPLLSLPCDEGIGLPGRGASTESLFSNILHTQPIPCAFPISCELTAGKNLLLDRAVDLYITAYVIYFYPARDKRAGRKSRKSMSAPSGVRFSAAVNKQIDGLVESRAVSSKSEFVRNAVDEALQRRGGGS